MNDAETSAVYAQEIMRLEKELAALHQDASSKWAFLEWRDRAEKAEAELTALQEQNKWLLHELKDAANRLTALGETTLSVRDCIKNIEEQEK